MPIVVTRDDRRRRFLAVASEHLDVRDIMGLGAYLMGVHRAYGMTLDLRAAMVAFAPQDLQGIREAGIRRQQADGRRGRLAIVADDEHLQAIAHAYAAEAARIGLPPVGVFSTVESAGEWLDEVALT